MITISELAPNVQQVKISGKVQSADMRQVVDLAETIGKGAEKASLVFEVENVEGLEWSALGEELSHLPAMWRMLTGLDRIAVIADQSWLRSAARIESALLPGVTYEVFSRDKAEQARAWARGEIDRPHADAVRLVDVGHSSMLGHSSFLAITHISSVDHADLKHQCTIDCRIRPLSFKPASASDTHDAPAAPHPTPATANASRRLIRPSFFIISHPPAIGVRA